MVLCLLSRDSYGDTTKLNHEETARGPEIAIPPEKSEILVNFPGGNSWGVLYIDPSRKAKKAIRSRICSYKEDSCSK